MKLQYEHFDEICQDAAIEINGKYKEMTNKMWEIGEVIVRKREKINPQYGDQFLAGISERMTSQPSIRHLGECERFYKKYPDLLTRVSKSELTPTHYQQLARTELTTEERERLEEMASSQKWTVSKLKTELKPPQRITFERTANDVIDDIMTKISQVRELVNELKNEMNVNEVSKNKADGVVTTLGLMLQSEIRYLITLAINSGGEPDPYIRELTKRWRNND